MAMTAVYLYRWGKVFKKIFIVMINEEVKLKITGSSNKNAIVESILQSFYSLTM